MNKWISNIYKSVLFVLLTLSGCSQSPEEEKLYDVGFRVYQTIDKTRIYKQDTDTTDYLHYRPIDVDIWYPGTQSGRDSIATFRDILGLLEKRAGYYTASQSWNGLTAQVAQSFCDGFKCSDTTRLLDFKTISYKNLTPGDRKFPLIIYMAAFNGMSYENFMLFEELARKGFVVASINSIGRFPGDMTMKNEDMMEQVYDALAALKHLQKEEFVDFSRIGIVGYSWGGLSGSVLASKIPGAACLISLEGSEFHHYGQSPDEDKDFDQITNSTDFSTMKLTIPYMRLEGSSNASSNADSIYNFSSKLGSEVLIQKIDSAEHHDFSCLPTFVRSSGECKNTPFFNKTTKLTIDFLEKHIKKNNL